MPKKTERIITATAAITLASATGTIGPIIGAAIVDYAVQKLEKRGGKKKS